jgi:hypothetical protein
MPRDKDGDYEVGYGKPPRHTRFVKGQSGNPRGQPNGPKNVMTMVYETLGDALDPAAFAAVMGKERAAMIRNLGPGHRKRLTSLIVARSPLTVWRRASRHALQCGQRACAGQSPRRHGSGERPCMQR